MYKYYINRLLFCMIMFVCIHCHNYENAKESARSKTKVVEGDNKCSSDSLVSFIHGLFAAKVQYEKDLHSKDTSLSTVSRKVYLDLLKDLLLRRQHYLECLPIMIDESDATFKGHFFQFQYYSPVLSRIPKCSHLSYRQSLELLLYNLKYMNSHTTDIVCSDSLFNEWMESID